MKVSVIIPTFNNAVMLATTLTAFESVLFPEEAELIVVDNNSTDDTAEIIQSFTGRLPIRYAYEPNQGVSAAKNRALSIAAGELMVFTDDDVRPDTSWLMTYLEAYRRSPKGYILGGPVVSEFEGPIPEQCLLKHAPPSVKGLNLGEEERILKDDEWFIGANWACTPDALSLVGLFDVAIGPYPGAKLALVGEETDLQKRLREEGYKALYLPKASIFHVVPTRKCTLEHVANRAEATGRYLRATSPEELGTKTLRGVPLWRYRKCVERWLTAWIKRITGRNWYPDYISYRADLGFIRGLPDGHNDSK